MLRVRFHGRGGHGIKTASRVLGTAAFLGGFQAQDSPVYGAERRGAAIVAFTRIDSKPICERGPVTDPDLILVADETLFADPAAGVRLGGDVASAMLVNSSRDNRSLEADYHIPCPVVSFDLTAITTELLGRGSALSAALGAAACALGGLKPIDVVLSAVQEELSTLHLAPAVVAKNVEVARRAYANTPGVTLTCRPASGTSSAMRAPVHLLGPEGVPVIFRPGNSTLRHTGSWRIFRPVIDLGACTRCGICFALCPDSAVTLDAKAYPAIDYDNCKGCMVCYQECPIHCIREEKEVRAW
jgi:pyruvate ferredoxin oxidoreductase gamma subunit